MTLYGRVLRDEEPKISIHELISLLNEISLVRKTAAEVKTHYAMDTTTGNQLDAVIATITGTAAVRAQRVAEIHYVLLIAEKNVGDATWYGTAASLQTRLGL
jgi:hypothetical protein